MPIGWMCRSSSLAQDAVAWRGALDRQVGELDLGGLRAALRWHSRWRGDVWGVRIPDLPGCHGGGDTVEAAIADAVSAAREWAEHRIAKGTAMPASRPLRRIIEDGEMDVQAGETAAMMPPLLDSGRPVRANLSLDAALLEAIDEAARARGLTRSAFIASAARERIMAEG
jgi:predicted RNase H-like HicB family nuclease